MTRLIFISTLIFAFTSQQIQAQGGPIPFQMAGKMILIKAQIGGISGNFILDTGTSHLVLNAKYFSGLRTEKIFTGVNGATKKVEADYFDVKIGDHQWNSIYAEIISLEHVEKLKYRQIHGLIGCRILRKYRMFIDYRASYIQLEKQGTKGSNTPYPLNPPNLRYPFRYKGDTPIIEVKLGNRELKLAIDTGAEINLFDQKLRDSFQTFLYAGARRNLSSFSTQQQNGRTYKMRDLPWETFKLAPMNTLFVSLSEWNTSVSGPRIDAILGFEFLVQFQVEINYKTKELALWFHHDPKTTVSIPSAHTKRSQ
ncbi:MAG: retropepsin-like domain-containing protein [Saprospiraceae bacterium]|nr:retropepsin-like domain-containing protein [Saprospiraceae bacterium]